MLPTPHHRPCVSRRDFLLRAGAGFGATALAGLMVEHARADVLRRAVTIDPVNPLAPRPPHFAARAKRVIFLFMYGGPSQVDTFDHKPLLAKLDGKPVPDALKQHKDKVGGVFNNCQDKLMSGPWKWKQHGKSGLWVSDLLPHTAAHADDLCVVRSMTSDSSNHAPATYQMNTGATITGRPSVGSWVTYGLGSENQSLPGFVLLFKVAGLGGSANWGNAFLPAAFQGTPFRTEGAPVLDLQPPAELGDTQRSTLDLLQALNRKHAAARPGLLDLDGRITSYELAYRMQSEALGVGDLTGETKQTLEMYGVDSKNKATALFGRMCLLSRRLVEKGVRFAQVYNAVDKLGWDGHDHSHDFHRRNALQVDQPVGALLTDLKRRGLLDETLVVWAGEFGRTPMEQGSGGRNHNPYGFSVWLAGGGVKGGQAIGATDDIGLRAEQSPFPVKDLHATILTALGLRPDDLFFEHNGRPERLTGVAGSSKPIPGVLA
jgi:hypothetical protein